MFARTSETKLEPQKNNKDKPLEPRPELHSDRAPRTLEHLVGSVGLAANPAPRKTEGDNSADDIGKFTWLRDVQGQSGCISP